MDTLRRLVGRDLIAVDELTGLITATALVGATLMYEILCLLAEIVAKR
mgnify:CR=1 FL=1